MVNCFKSTLFSMLWRIGNVCNPWLFKGNCLSFALVQDGIIFFLLLYGGIFKIFLCLIFVDYGKYHFIECSLFYFHLLYGGWTLCPPHLVVSLFI